MATRSAKNILWRIVLSRWFACIIPALLGLGAGFLCIHGFERYGWALFIALPLAVTFLASFLYCLGKERSFGSAYGTSMLSLLTLGSLILLFALDGLICLLMALPLTAILAFFGTMLGNELGKVVRGHLAAVIPLLLVLVFPCLVAFEDAQGKTAPERSVSTRVTITAPASKVWQEVVAFTRITAPPTGIFCCGVAYPIEATIIGRGVGAVRHCTFSTGSFVEPITKWDEPRLLAFDVTSSPPPLEEFSLYEHIDVPHLHGHMNSHRGQFLLKEEGGTTILEGTTWYSHSMWPQWYWGPISDEIIHRIHHRVLGHIKETVEREN